MKQIIPDENVMALHPPPFRSVAADIQKPTDYFWDEFGALSEIDPDEALIIADFEIGSDSLMILDYRVEPAPVLRLRWFLGPKVETQWVQTTHWVPVAPSISAFLSMFKLA